MQRRKLSLIHFKVQPEFPVEDMSEENAAMATYYVGATHEVEAYAEVNRNNLQRLHEVGNAALIGAEVKPGNTKGEYEAFCHGFGTLDYLATLLGSRSFKQFHHGASMQHFFLQHDEMADFELWQRRQVWIDSHQNTLDVMRTISDVRAETPKERAARMMGAQVASELLYIA